jgi:cytosine/adenosine deaminase-related metal-dependent hydrolase
VTTSSYWCELAVIDGTVHESVLIEIEGGVISAIAFDAAAPAGAHRLRGVTIPGLANAHSHAFHRALRSRTQSGRGSFWSWRELMYHAAEGLDPDRYHRLARAVYTEMALAGITVVGEFHYLHHRPDGGCYDDPNAMGHALTAAAADAGVRMTLLDALYLHGGVDSAGYLTPSGVQRRFSDGTVEAWAGRVEQLRATVSSTAAVPTVATPERDPASAAEGPANVAGESLPAAAVSTPAADGPANVADESLPGAGVSTPATDRTARSENDIRAATLRIGAAVHSVRAVDPASIETAAAWATDRRLPLHAHVSEQPAENDSCRAHHGRTPIGVLGDAGALGDRCTAVHATHVDADDVAALASTRTTVCMCPTTERDLGDGIGPTARFAQADVPISLGSDAHAVIDLLEEARAVELDERLRSGERGVHGAVRLLSMATVNGHRSLGWHDAGELAVGNRADLVTIALDSVRTSGAGRAHAIEAVVFAAAAGDVTDVVIDGRRVVVDRHHVSIDAAAELDAVISELMS